MKIGLLSGAYKNAGDFLIEKRAEELLEHFLENIEIYHFLRNEINDNFQKVNQMDCVVFTGGPVYMQKLEKHIYLKNKLSPPIAVLGGGWDGLYPANNLTANYNFSNFTKHFLNQVDNFGFGLACRDIYTYEILKKCRI